ncbi:MAG: hypothetical protein OXC12_06820 [Spirochaetaceae bacterium]|nr:hypothetical protein [Spirochaetaceae bacterium]
MSSPQPARQPARKAPGAIQRAKSSPTIENAVDAISALHDDMIVNQSYQREVNVRMENRLTGVEAGINALLDHFDIPRQKA